ncbi:MAG: iron-sulfur cluster-binding protein [Spirochaetia bacterium]|nr:iron-sulfur cluster-binding protein [Spirochaetia bacterium]
MIIRFMLNNMKKNLDADPADKLSDVLRDDFGLQSVNSGCNTGRCGGCTVLKDNIPVPACMVKMFSVRNSNILTYEYISTTIEFETITKVLNAMGCNFCDFCKHGKMITIYSLIMNGIPLTDKEIYDALSGNICNCTDFQSMATGIRLAMNAIKRGKRERKQ